MFNFNQQAFVQLAGAAVNHADETGVDVDATRHWLNCLSNERWTHYQVHRKRGCEAMNEFGILPRFHGIPCHDHWKPCYTCTGCTHALCNAHHLRELTRAWEQHGG